MKKTHCNNCKGPRNHKELFEKKTRGGEDDGFVWFEKFKVIECLGCENISFLKVYGDISMVDYDQHGNANHYDEETVYPYYLEKGEEIKYQHHLPSTIRIIYQETISAFKADSYILTAGGLRAIIEAICNQLKIKNDNLEKRIDSLHKKGHLTLSESKRLHSIRFLGNDALHEMAKPKKEHLYLLLEIVNHLLANLFINDKIIKGKVETVIDKYEEFLNLIENLITEKLLKKELTLSELLGKSKRLIEKSKYPDFQSQFEKEVKSKKIDFLEINPISEEKETTYFIIKVPEQSLPW